MREGGCRFRKVVTISKFREAKDFKEKYSLLITSKQLDVYHAWRGSAKNCIRIELNYAKFITTFKAEPITSCDFQRWLLPILRWNTPQNSLPTFVTPRHA